MQTTQKGKQDEAIGAVCVFASAVVFVSVHLCGWPRVYVRVCMRMCVCICVYSLYREYLLSLAAGETWGHRAVAASPLLGHQIQQL